MDQKINREAWQEGFESGAWERCPYPAGTVDAWSWRQGRNEAQEASEGGPPGSAA